MYNELLFCKFEELGKKEYLLKEQKRLLSLYNDMEVLNADFTDYMYALSRTEYENNKQDLERIRISVKAMSDVVEEFAD